MEADECALLFDGGRCPTVVAPGRTLRRAEAGPPTTVTPELTRRGWPRLLPWEGPRLDEGGGR